MILVNSFPHNRSGTIDKKRKNTSTGTKTDGHRHRLKKRRLRGRGPQGVVLSILGCYPEQNDMPDTMSIVK